jgi:hypothetical protein
MRNGWLDGRCFHSNRKPLFLNLTGCLQLLGFPLSSDVTLPWHTRRVQVGGVLRVHCLGVRSARMRRLGWVQLHC